MAVTHPSSMRSLIADTVTAQADGGSTLARLLLQDSGSTTVVTMKMASTAFGAAAAGVCTANSITNSTALLGATVTIGLITNSTLTTVCAFSVTSTGGGGDLELSSNVLSSGQTVSITALTYTAPT